MSPLFLFSFFFTLLSVYFLFTPESWNCKSGWRGSCSKSMWQEKFPFVPFSLRGRYIPYHIYSYVVDPRKPLFCLQHLSFLFFPYVLPSWFQQFFVLYLNSEFPVNFSSLFFYWKYSFCSFPAALHLFTASKNIWHQRLHQIPHTHSNHT